MTEPLVQLAPTEPAHDEGKAAPAAISPPQPLTGMAKWVHEHRDATTKPVGHMTYQVIRNIFAAVPYGIATIAVWSGFEHLDKYASTKAANAAGKSEYFWEGLRKLSKSPLKDIAMIAAGFTLYRGTLKLVKFTKERLFNPDNSEADTKREVDNFGSNLVKDLGEIAPAEVNSTTYGAIALGLGRRYLNGIEEYRNRPPEAVIAQKPLFAADGTKIAYTGAQQRMFRWLNDEKKLAPSFDWQQFKTKVFSRASRPWMEAGVFIASFLTFFEVSDRLYKDVQIRRGIYKENHNSITRIAPEKAAIKEADEKGQGLDKDAKYQIEKRGEGKHTGLFDGEPNWGRMLMTRVLSTALGIGAYTFTKRAAYATMGHFTSAPTFWQKAFVEGAATATFFVMTTSNDVIEGLYKKHVLKPQEKTPLQQQKHDELLAKLNEKERGKGVAA